MEARKNPSKDVHRLSGMFFQLGLGISIALAIVVMEWTNEFQKAKLRITEDPVPDLVYIPATNTKEPPPPSPTKSEIIPTSNKIPNDIIETSTTDDNTEETTFTLGEYSNIPTISIEPEPEENFERVFTAPQKRAEPIGGYAGFYDMVGKNMKYPSKARRYGVEGKVFIEFIVNKDGTPTDFKTIRGLGYGCDEEAIRVISLSRWNPGEQRGRAVRVKMVLPVIFKLD